MSQIKKTVIHPAHAEFDGVPDEKKFVRVYNKAEGALKHDIRIKEDGGTATQSFEIKGNSFATVPKEVADLWLRDFPDRIVSDNEARTLVSGATAEADKAKAELAKAREELAAMKAKTDPKGELAKARAEADKLRGEADELRRQNQELLEKATAPAGGEQI